MPAGNEPADVPCYETQAALEKGYGRAEREGIPFLAVERYEDGYAVTYDLLPTGHELSKPARKELEERLTRELERIVGDDAMPTAEVGKTVGESLGTIGLFDRDSTAQSAATVVSGTVIDEVNWVEATPAEPSPHDDRRRN